MTSTGYSIATFASTSGRVHYSDKPGLTVCGKRTEPMDATSRYVDCQYCVHHAPIERITLRASADPLQGPGPGDVSGQVIWDIRDSWLHGNES